MNISKLELKTYRGYKDICRVIEDKYCSGKQKILQLKEWKRYFDWIEHGRYEWEITVIYDIPKPKIDGRVNNGGARNIVYADHIDYLILKEVQAGVLQETIYQLGVRFGQLNNRFLELYVNIEKFAGELQIDYRYLILFYSNVAGIIKTAINGSLNRLEQLGCIKYEIVDYYIKVDSNKPLQMTEDVRKDIKALRSAINDRINEQNKEEQEFNLLFKKKLDDWYNAERILKKQIKEQLGIKNTFKKYMISGIAVSARLNELDSKYGKHFDHKKELNQKIKDRIVQNAIRHHEKNQDDPFWNVEGVIYKKEYRELKDSKEYIEVMKKCADYFISID